MPYLNLSVFDIRDAMFQFIVVIVDVAPVKMYLNNKIQFVAVHNMNLTFKN